LNRSKRKINRDHSAGAGPLRNYSPGPGPSKRTSAKTNPYSSTSMTPEQLRPFPQATDREGTANTTRKKRATATLTDTPIKSAL